MNAEQLDDATKQALQQWTEQELNKSKFRSQVHNLTDECFGKCIKSATSAGLTNAEATCVQNCAGRFLDINNMILKQIASADS